MEYKKPILEFNLKGDLIRYIIGTCDTCMGEINNCNESVIADKGKIYHANNICYKGT